MNTLTGINGLVVEPGDLVLGYLEGVPSVGYDLVAEVHAATSKKHEAETKQMHAIGRSENNRRWVDAALEKAGCINV